MEFYLTSSPYRCSTLSSSCALSFARCSLPSRSTDLFSSLQSALPRHPLPRLQRNLRPRPDYPLSLPPLDLRPSPHPRRRRHPNPPDQHGLVGRCRHLLGMHLPLDRFCCAVDGPLPRFRQALGYGRTGSHRPSLSRRFVSYCSLLSAEPNIELISMRSQLLQPRLHVLIQPILLPLAREDGSLPEGFAAQPRRQGYLRLRRCRRDVQLVLAE